MNINELDKDQLAAYAKTEFKVNLDMRKRLADLQKQVEKLNERKPNVVTQQPAKPKPEFLRNTQTGIHFLYTEAIEKYLGDLAVPCDADGNVL